MGSFAPFSVYYPDEGALPHYPTLPATWRSLFASVVACSLCWRKRSPKSADAMLQQRYCFVQQEPSGHAFATACRVHLIVGAGIGRGRADLGFGCELAGIGLPHALRNVLELPGVQLEVDVQGLIDDEAEVARGPRGDRVERRLLVAPLRTLIVSSDMPSGPAAGRITQCSSASSTAPARGSSRHWPSRRAQGHIASAR